jgi:hypothetical protein
MKKVFFHIHLWKTAGTSFLNICSENFKKQFRRDTMLIQDWFLSLQQLQWLLDYHDWLRCYSCHMLNGDLPYDNTSDIEVIGIAFVRNPVNRFISSYNFQSGKNYRGGIAKEFKFDEFLQKTLVDDDNQMWRNGQTFVLGGSGTETGLAVVSERIKKKRLILLPTERFDESCVLLERLFQDDFKDCSYTRQNVSKSTASISEQQRTTIAQYMNIDFKLFDLANVYLDETLDHLFLDRSERQQYLDNFRRRCGRKKLNKQAIYLVKNPISAVKAVMKKVIR